MSADSLKTFASAIIVSAAAGYAAQTDGADHFDIDHDRTPAGVGEETELHELPRQSARIIAQLGVANRSRLAGLQRGLSFEHARVHVVIEHAVAAFLVDERAVSIEDVDRSGAASRCSPVAASSRDFLSRFA